MHCLPAVTAPPRGFSGRVSPEEVNVCGGDAAEAALPVRKRRLAGDGLQLGGERSVNVLGFVRPYNFEWPTFVLHRFCVGPASVFSLD